MHICYVADARSPIAKNWISYFVARNHQVTVLSSYPCAPDEIPGARLIEFPFAFGSLSRMTRSDSNHGTVARFRKKLLSELRSRTLLSAFHSTRTWIAPLDVLRRTPAMSALIDDLKPNIVHAMRLPFEGFIAAAAVKRVPLLLSVWGNDFTLFADHSRKLAALTNSALQRADGLHCDCNRDLNLALARGFRRGKPWRVLPGNGGVQEFFFNSLPDRKLLQEFCIPENVPLIINPRGFRTYVHSESFFKAIRLVLQRIPNVFFAATGMLGNPVAERWVRQLNIAGSVRLLPTMSREELASLFAAARVSVSPSSHDGTPNTLLEALAGGCFPIAGDIESVREWIVDGENGLLCRPEDPSALAACIVRALLDSDLRTQATAANRKLVRQRAEYQRVMESAEYFYDEVLVGAHKTRIFPAISCSDCSNSAPAIRKAL